MSLQIRIGPILGALILLLVIPLFAWSGGPAKSVPAEGGVAVVAGRVTGPAGEPLAGARVRVIVAATDMRLVEADTPHRRIETTTGPTGEYRLEVEGLTTATDVTLDAMKPGYARLSGMLMKGSGGIATKLSPGRTETVAVTLQPSRYFKGVVIDELGKPIPGVQLTVLATGAVERTSTNLDGTFEIFNLPLEPILELGRPVKEVVRFRHADYLGDEISDVAEIPPDQRASLRTTLRRGVHVSGTVRNAVGRPVASVMVKVVREDGNGRKAVLTDSEGRFAVKGLSSGPSTLSVQAMRIKQKIRMSLTLERDLTDIDVGLELMPLRDDPPAHDVLGLRLSGVNRETQEAYGLMRDSGVLILDAGPGHERLEIGELAAGDLFWMVGETPVTTVREFVDQLVTEAAEQNEAAGEMARKESLSVRVVYSMSRLTVEGANTQYIKLTPDDLAKLTRLLETLKAD